MCVYTFWGALACGTLAAGAAHPAGPFQEHPGSLHQQLQLPFAITGLSGQQSWSPAFSNAEAELRGQQSWSPALSMPMKSRAQAQPSAGLTVVPLIVT